MSTTILRLPKVKESTGLSRSQIYDLIRRRQFPRQIELGLRAVGWDQADIDNWIAQRKDKTNQKRNKKLKNLTVQHEQ